MTTLFPLIEAVPVAALQMNPRRGRWSLGHCEAGR